MGEDTALTSLAALRENTPKPYNLIIWNNGCKDPEFIKSLDEFSGNVINCTKNQGLLEAMNYAFITSTDDVVIFTCAGVYPQKGYFERILTPFLDERVGVVAEYQFSTDENVVCGEDNIPEGVEAYSKKMINEIGALCPSFRIWGTAPTELKIRAMKKGWKVIGVSKCARHINREGQGKDKLGSEFVHYLLIHNNYVFNTIKRRGFDYKWWKNDLLLEADSDDLTLDANQVLH